MLRAVRIVEQRLAIHHPGLARALVPSVGGGAREARGDATREVYVVVDACVSADATAEEPPVPGLRLREPELEANASLDRTFDTTKRRAHRWRAFRRRYAPFGARRDIPRVDDLDIPIAPGFEVRAGALGSLGFALAAVFFSLPAGAQKLGGLLGDESPCS